MMPGRQICAELYADAFCKLRVQIQVGRRVVEPVADFDQLILVDGINHVRRGGVLVIQCLELRRERRPEIQPEACVLDARLFRRLEYVQSALILRAEVLNRDRPPRRDDVITLGRSRLGGGNRIGLGCRCRHVLGGSRSDEREDRV